MPRQGKVIHFSGKMGGHIYYYRKDRKKRKHYFTRSAPETVMQTSATKRAATDFGTASKCSRLVRHALHEYTRLCYDNRLHARLNGKMVKIVRADLNHASGQRVLKAANMQSLQYFQFNNAAGIHQLLNTTPVIEQNDSGISISLADTFSKRCHALRNTTHITVKAIALSVNFVKGTTRQLESNTVVIKYGKKSETATLTININRRDLTLIILEVQSFFEGNVKSHNKKAHALDVISVLPPVEAPKEKKKKYLNKVPHFWLPYMPPARPALIIKRVNCNSLPEG
jgi:hypothetical protein